MKKFCMILMAVLTVSAVYGKTLRVNNHAGNAAPYTSVDAALADAEAGDIIILEKSNTSYGEVSITKPVTLQGEGYFLDINQPDNEGASSSIVTSLYVRCSDVKIFGIYVNHETMIKEDRVVMSRCNVRDIGLNGATKACTDCIIHQNFVRTAIGSGYYSDNAHNIQITNNIFASADLELIFNFDNCVISHNTFQNGVGDFSRVKNSKIEYNINGIGHVDNSNILVGNKDVDINSKYFKNDKVLSEYESALNLDAGAFSGNDPYVLSGIARGVRVTDLDMPQSVEQGSDLQIAVKVATRR